MMHNTMHDAEILIVDDEESLRITFEMFLRRDGYGNISTAATFEQAKHAVREKKFDLVISDVVLEGATGTDLLKHIRNIGLDCPVVMITGFPNINSASEAVRHGAFDYIPKPVNKDSLLRFVKQALSHWQLQKEKNKLLRENEKYRRYLEAIFSSVTDAIITVNEKLEITQVNDAARVMIGDHFNGNTGVNLKNLPGEMGKACFLDAHKIVVQGELVREHQMECIQSDGSIRMISMNASPIKDESGEFSGAVLVARDLTLDIPDEKWTKRFQFQGFIGASNVLQDIYRLIENVGRVDTAVLIIGESGTGKELAAEALHAESKRRDQPLVKVDCAAIPEDILESELFGHCKGAFTGADRDRSGRLLQADTGSLFLDEIGDISPKMQLRLLRFLQEKTFTPVGSDRSIKVDVRIIAATNVDLRSKMRKGEFREDLYYRLKVVEIYLPPLRDRIDCIPVLVQYFLEKFSKEMNKKIIRISDQAMNILTSYRWPGNVRELRHVMERACVLCSGSTLLMENFEDELIQSSLGFADGENEATFDSAVHGSNKISVPGMMNGHSFMSEENQILEALKACGGNKVKASKLLGFDRATLYRKMKKYNLPQNPSKSK